MAQGDRKIVELLLSRGDDVNTQGSPYHNAIEAASKSGYPKIIELLLSRGADSL